MFRKASPGKTCKEYERRWRDFCVDERLEDSWLERLNDLACFKLIGLCEGHADRRAGSSGRFAHIVLRLKAYLLPGIAGRWDELRVALLNEVNQLFQSGETHVNVELKFKLRAGRGRMVYQEDFTIRVRRFEARTMADMDRETYRWFEEVVERIEKLDQVVGAWANDES